MNKRLRIFLNLVLVLVLAVSAVVLVIQQIRWHESAKAQEKAAEAAQFTPPVQTEAPPLPSRFLAPSEPAQSEDPGVSEMPPEPTEAPPEPSAPAEPEPEETDPVADGLSKVNLAALQSVNPDVVGWIYVPGTNISYPLLQGVDNSYYLEHSWEKRWTGGGSIYIDWRCSRALDGFNTILYGHRMNNGTMFGPLQRYESLDFWRMYPYVYIVDSTYVHRYAVFAAGEISVTSEIYTTVEGGTPEERQAFLDLCTDSSQLDTGVLLGPEDKVLTLSTCTYVGGRETRWVVQAVLDQVYEGAVADLAGM